MAEERKTKGLFLASDFKVFEDKCENLPGTALYLLVPEEGTKNYAYLL